MILEFSVKNFASIKETATLSFEATNDTTHLDEHTVVCGNKRILKTAMIVGPNASGKTNLLNALRFFMNFIENSFTTLKPNSQTGVSPFAFDPVLSDAPTEFSLAFFIGQIKYEYILHLTLRAVVYEELNYFPKRQKKLMYRRDSAQETPFTWGDSLGGNRKETAAMTRANIPFLTAAAQLNHPILKEIFAWFQGHRMPFISPDPSPSISRATSEYIFRHPEMKDDILTLLKSADLSHIEDIAVREREIEKDFLDFLTEDAKKELLIDNENPSLFEVDFIHRYGGIRTPLPLRNESRGTQRLYALSVPFLLSTKADGLIMVDELDTSLHQEVLHLFIKAFIQRSQGAQLIFTCHNLDILETDILRRDEIWLCDKDYESGGSGYHCVSDFTGIRKDASLRRVYLAGKLGARPITDITLLD